MDDANLVKHALAGDRSAFDCLVERHFGLAYAIGLARLGDRESAEDLAQEVFLRAFVHLGDLRDPRLFGCWVGRAARNLALDWERKNQNRSKVLPLISHPPEGLLEQVADPQQGVRERMEEESEAQTLHEAISRLPVEQRELILLHYMQGMTKAEIAERLRVHPSTAGRQIDRAVGALRGMFEPLLRKTMGRMGPSPKAAVKTLGLAGALMALGESARAQLLGAAAWKEGAAAFGAAAQIVPGPASLGTWIMRAVHKVREAARAHSFASKAILAAGGAVIVAGALLAYEPSSKPPAASAISKGVSARAEALPAADQAPKKSSFLRTASTVSSPVRSAPLTAEDVDALPDPPFGYRAQACQCSTEFSFGGRQGSRNFFFMDGLDMQTAVRTGWGIAPGRIRSAVPLNEPVVKFMLEGPLDAPEEEFQTVLKTELQRAFHARVRFERRREDVLVLSAPSGIPDAFTPAAPSSLPLLKTLEGFRASGKSIADFADALEAETLLPVIEETGLKDHYDYQWSGEAREAAVEEFGFLLEPDIREILVAVVEAAKD